MNCSGRDEEGIAPPDAVDIVRDAQRPSDQRDDDEDPSCRKGLPFPGSPPDGAEPRSDRQIQAAVRTRGARGGRKQMNEEKIISSFFIPPLIYI